MSWVIFADNLKVYVCTCLMPKGSEIFRTVGIEIVNFGWFGVNVTQIQYGSMTLLPGQQFSANDTTMPHFVNDNDRWFLFFNQDVAAGLDLNNLETVTVTTDRGYIFTSAPVTGMVATPKVRDESRCPACQRKFE